MKKLALCMVTLLTVLSTTSTVFAGQWYKEGSYWRYTKDYQYAVQDDWINDGGAWYYINPSGFMSTGWKDVKGTILMMEERWLQIVGLVTTILVRVVQCLLIQLHLTDIKLE